MESPTPPNKSQEKPENSAFPFLVLALLWVCALGISVIFCGGVMWMSLQQDDFSLLATAIPTIDIVQQTSADPAWIIALNEEFSSNAHDWPVSSYENDSVRLERKISDGIYTWDFESKSGWNFYAWPDMRQVNDFVVTADFTHTQGSTWDGYGFLMRTSGDNYYTLEINEQGRYVFGYYYLDEFTTLLEGEKTKIIEPYATNRVSVKAIGPLFTIYINNVQIGEVEDDTFSSGRIGLLISPSGRPGGPPKSDPQGASLHLQTEYPSTFEVDNFKVWVPSSGQKTDEENLPLLKPRQGRIIYVSSRDGNREIYSINTDGTDPDRLTHNPADDFSPEWSPDGKRVAFVSTREGNPDIFVMDRDGSNMTRLTDNPADDLDPSWSPEGDKIVFTSNRDGNYNLYILDVELKTIERLTEAAYNDRYPDWSPDGDLVIFQSNRESSADFYTVEVETGNIRRLTFDKATSLAHPSWSPNGMSYVHEMILYEGQTGISIRDFPNKNYATVVEMRDQNLWPAWSPDGAQIVFVSDRDGQVDIYIINKAGDAIYRLTEDEAIESEVDWIAE
ncbi:MAG: DPP IV N-terminal domain-containing protein [Chloroflexota bacterium]